MFCTYQTCEVHVPSWPRWKHRGKERCLEPPPPAPHSFCSEAAPHQKMPNEELWEGRNRRRTPIHTPLHVCEVQKACELWVEFSSIIVFKSLVLPCWLCQEWPFGEGCVCLSVLSGTNELAGQLSKDVMWPSTNTQKKKNKQTLV